MGYPYSAQPVLVSGANIKTIGGESVLGSGDIDAVTSEALQAALGPYVTSDAVDTLLEGYASIDEVVPFVLDTNPTPEPNRRFTFKQDQFDLPQGGGYQNIVQRWGYNINRPNQDEPSGHISIESKFLLNNVGPYVMEFHIEGEDINGVPYRLFSAIEPIDKANVDTGSAAAFNVQIFQLCEADMTQRIKYDWVTNNVDFIGQQVHRFSHGGAAFMFQKSANSEAFLTLPYFDSEDRYYIPAISVVFDGSLSIAGNVSCDSVNLAYGERINLAHQTLGQNGQFQLGQNTPNVLSLLANTNAGIDIYAASDRVVSRGKMSVNDPNNTVQNQGALTELSVLGSLGLYTTQNNVGAAIYLGDSNFNGTHYWNAAPGFRAIDTGQGIASGLGIYTYTGVNTRTLAIEVTHQQYVKCTSRFACNGNTPQAKQSVNAAATDAATTQALVNQLRTALINVGICV